MGRRSGRADPALKPDPHRCCPNATHLRCVSSMGMWGWSLYMLGARFPVIHCPWCGVELPHRRAVKLELVRT